MAFVSRKWESVTKEKFNTGKFLAHEDYDQTVRGILNTKDKLKTLVREYEKNLSNLDEDNEDISDQENQMEEVGPDDEASSEDSADAATKANDTNKSKPV